MSTRRTILGMIGIAPVMPAIAESAASPQAAGMVNTTYPWKKLPLTDANAVMTSSGDTFGMLREGVKAGLIDEATARAIVLEARIGDYSDYETELEAYKSFSAVTKKRMMKQRVEQRAWEGFMAGNPDARAKARAIIKDKLGFGL